MKSTASIFTPLMILSAVVMLVAGCSHDNSLEPTSASPVTQSFVVDPLEATDPGIFVETYDSRHNEGGWSFHTTHKPVIEEEGGNPGGYLHDESVITFAPSPSTAPGIESIFTGNYRERKVTSLGIDLRCLDYEYDITNRYLALMLMNDNGTPLDEMDDWGAYIIGSTKLPSKYVAWLSSTTTNEPGWVNYDFEIQSQSGSLPDGWVYFRNGSGAAVTPGGSWKQLMDNVSYVRFFYGDPELYYILQSFDLGLDNPRITWEE
ncbi:MAG: hypothetical protein AB1483_01620 [Candidatus Zixiibacteriota bacterium]